MDGLGPHVPHAGLLKRFRDTHGGLAGRGGDGRAGGGDLREDAGEGVGLAGTRPPAKDGQVAVGRGGVAVPLVVGEVGQGLGVGPGHYYKSPNGSELFLTGANITSSGE